MKKDKKEIHIIEILSYIILIINSVLTAYWGELIWRMDSYETLKWASEETKFFLCAIFAIFIIELGMFMLSNNIFVSAVITDVFAYSLILINYFKYDLKGEVFQFSDLSLYREALSVLSEFTIQFTSYLIAGLLFCIIRCAFIWQCEKLAHIKLEKKLRIVEGIIGVMICLSAFKLIPWMYDKVEETPVIYTAANYYEEVGVMAGFFKTIPRKPEQPQNYTKAAVEDALNNISAYQDNQIRPNVIFIMEESFADITALDGVKLSEDPLESFKKYQDEYISGKLLSPTYGGNTCQVEFEVLTGYPAYNMPGNAYTDYISYFAY